MGKQLYFVFLLLSSLMFSCGKDAKNTDEIDSTKVEQTTNLTAPNGNRTFQLGKVKGYRIQVHTTLKREEALKYKAIFQNHFPDMPSYLVYEDPVYKVRVGDYLSKGEAKDFAVYVNKVNDLYGSFVVKCMVNAIIQPSKRDTTSNIVGSDSVQQINWADSSGKKILGAPTEEVLTKEDIAAERKMQQEDKEAEKATPTSTDKVETPKKADAPKVEKNTKFKSATTAKDTTKKK